MWAEIFIGRGTAQDFTFAIIIWYAAKITPTL